MAVLCYRHNTVSASRLHMKNIAWHALICLPIETPLNRLQTSCGSSAVHRLGRRHLSAHASLYLFVGRQTGARVTLCCSQSLCVAARLQSQQKLLIFTEHPLDQVTVGLLAAGVTHQVCFLKITFLRRQTCFRARRYGINILWWNEPAHLGKQVSFNLCYVCADKSVPHTRAAWCCWIWIFLFWSSSDCTRSEIPET